MSESHGDLTTAMVKLDAAGLDEMETQAVAEFLAMVLSEDDDAEVSGFGFDQKPRGFLGDMSGMMKPPVKGWSWGASQGYTDAGRVMNRLVSMDEGEQI